MPLSNAATNATKTSNKCICIATSSDPHVLHFPDALADAKPPTKIKQNRNHSTKNASQTTNTHFLSGAVFWEVPLPKVSRAGFYHPRPSMLMMHSTPGTTVRETACNEKNRRTLLEVLHWKRVLLIKVYKRSGLLHDASSVAYLFLSYLWMHVSIQTLH